MTRQIFRSTKRLVVKLGSNVITEENGINIDLIDSISYQISYLMQKGIEVILVSSGATAAGMKKMSLSQRPDEIPKRQALSAIGQSDVIHAYKQSFAKHGYTVAQVLLTLEDLINRKRYLHCKNTLKTLIDWKVIPIINENDPIMVREIEIGDNDNLSAIITLLMDADLLCILSDIDGLYDKDPRQVQDAKIIPRVEQIHREIESFANSVPGALGKGGMLSKIHAARKVTSSGIPTIITNGNVENVLLKIFNGHDIGTYFTPKKWKLASRKCWIAHSVTTKGSIFIDDGAVLAVRKKGKSLLPIGVFSVAGDFEEGAAIDFRTSENEIIGVGLVNYSSSDIELIKGLKSDQIESRLGRKHHEEIIHRNNLVLKDF